jgi:hypothetical protein
VSDFYFNALAAECRHALKDDGYSILHAEDLNTIRELVDILGKPYLTPRLSPFLNDFTPNNCFWLLLTQGEQTVAAGGCRFDDLGNMKLSQFWKNCVARHYQRTGGAVVDVAPPVDEHLSGRLAYFGDLIVHEDFRGAKAGRVLKRFTHFAIAFAMLKFAPDSVYAFVREKDIGRGAMKFYGFNTVIHNAQTWSNAPDYHRDDDACFLVSQKYFSYYAKLMVQSPEKL